VLEQVIALSRICSVVPLLGNHEEMLLAALEGGKSEIQYWLKFGGAAALASYGWQGDLDLRPADLRRLIPGAHIAFLKNCRDYFESVRHIFVHAYYDPHLPLYQQKWSGLRWASLPPIPERHGSGKVAIVGHTPQKTGDILDLGYLKCIDTFCHNGGWLTGLEVETGQVWQTNEAGQRRA
jgi:serine/threonine protein phosphatase 1